MPITAEANPISDSYPRVTSNLCVDGAASGIDFYREVFGATERGDRFLGLEGTIGHA